MQARATWVQEARTSRKRAHASQALVDGVDADAEVRQGLRVCSG